MSPKKNPNRLRTDLGPYLTELREQNTTLTTAKAARSLGFKNRQKLDSYETGKAKPDDETLIEIARLYGVHPEKVLQEAHWPQLVMLPLISIVNPEQLTEDIIVQIEQGFQVEERHKLTQYVTEIIQERKVSIKISK